MPWSVVMPNRTVYDVVCRKVDYPGPNPIVMYWVNLQRYLPSKDTVSLGRVMKSYDDSWWILTGNPAWNLRGFKTRRHAINQMLFDQGYYEERQ